MSEKANNRLPKELLTVTTFTPKRKSNIVYLNINKLNAETGALQLKELGVFIVE